MTKEQIAELVEFIEAKLLNRDIIGTDVNPESLEVCSEKINFKFDILKIGPPVLPRWSVRPIRFWCFYYFAGILYQALFPFSSSTYKFFNVA